ncbi:MAG: C40 family peptidase [Clostridia bacterium]|nr:C40 family peptidase [Clostridia bacterium]
MKYLMRRTVCLLLAILVLLSWTAPALAGGIKAYFSSSARVYQKASASSRSVKVGKGTKVTIVGVKGNVAMIRKNGVTAFCDIRKLTLSSSIHVYAKNGCRVYRQASGSSKSAAVAANTDLYIVGMAGDFFRVKNKGGSVTAWVKRSQVSTSRVKAASAGKKVSFSSGATGRTGRLLSVAASLVGRPYSSSANPPRSFDCSRFVSYCYKQIGVNISPIAENAGYSNHKRITSISGLKAGDIVVFNTNPNDGDLSDHVGIYVGSGKFVHASSTGGKVMVSGFSDYYKRAFSWGLRVL